MKRSLLRPRPHPVSASDVLALASRAERSGQASLARSLTEAVGRMGGGRECDWDTSPVGPSEEDRDADYARGINRALIIERSAERSRMTGEPRGMFS